MRRGLLSASAEMLASGVSLPTTAASSAAAGSTDDGDEDEDDASRAKVAEDAGEPDVAGDAVAAWRASSTRLRSRSSTAVAVALCCWIDASVSIELVLAMAARQARACGAHTRAAAYCSRSAATSAAMVQARGSQL